MDSIDFEFGSAKNIPLASKKEYMEMMIQALEKFNKNVSWHLLNSIIYLICLICYLYVLPIVDLVYVCLLSKLPEDWLKNHETLCSSDLNKLIFLFNSHILAYTPLSP